MDDNSKRQPIQAITEDFDFDFTPKEVDREDSDAWLAARMDWLLDGLEPTTSGANAIESLRPAPIEDETNGSNKVTALEPKKTVRSASNKVTKRFRRSDRVDQEALKKIQKIGSSTIVVGVGSVTNFTPYVETSLQEEDTLKTNDNYSLPAWEHTSDRLKVAMAMRSLTGVGYAFTLNLGPARLEEALLYSDGLSACLSGYFNRKLQNVLGRVPMYLFSVEMTCGQKLHLHGAIECTSNELDQIKFALHAAAGKGWESKKRGEKQVHLTELYDPDGWTRYSLTDTPKARRVIKGKAIFIGKKLRVLAKAIYHKEKDRLAVGK